MMLEMRVYIEKRHKSRENEQPSVWFTPPIDYDELEERIGVTDQEPDYVIRDCLCQMVDELPESVQKNIETLLMEYGNVRNLYEHFVTNQNPVL